MQKYRQTRLLVQQWVESTAPTNIYFPSVTFRVSPLATTAELETTHCPSYIRRYRNGDLTDAELRNVGFPWSPQGVARSLSSTGGTIAAAVTAVEQWIQQQQRNHDTDHGSGDNIDRRSKPMAPWAAHIAGGTHHAFYDRGEGFCVFSDIAVAANVVLQRFHQLVRKILILDLDVHQGNGNAVLFRNEPRVFAFSLHCEKNYFSKKEQSDLDIELPEGCNDATYLGTLNHWLNRIRNERRNEFDLIFFQAGVDVLECDRLGRFALTPEGVQRRNELVYKLAKDLDVPLVITMGGGYPRKDDWGPIISAHANVYTQAISFLGDVHREVA
jgi:acetoin utilization deacetylase AcuC-like enzyme